MISQTKTTQRDPARGAVVGGLVGAVFLGTILAVQFWLTYNKMNDGFGFGIVAAVVLPIWGSIIGAVIGALIGAVAVHTARIIGQRMIGSLIGMGVAALIGVIAVLLLINWIHPNRQAWTIPIYLLLLGGMLPGIFGGIAGNRPQTITTSVCATCGQFVRTDATFCKYCKTQFE